MINYSKGFKAAIKINTIPVADKEERNTIWGFIPTWIVINLLSYF